MQCGGEGWGKGKRGGGKGREGYVCGIDWGIGGVRGAYGGWVFAEEDCDRAGGKGGLDF